MSALIDLRRKHQINWQEFADFLTVDKDTLQSWLDGFLPPQSDFDSLMSWMARTDPFNREDIEHVVNGYYRSTRSVDKSRYTADLLNDRIEKIYQSLSPAISFAEALQQARKMLGFSWNEFAETVGINVNTLKGWQRGRLPDGDVFDDFMASLEGLGEAGLKAHKILQKSYNVAFDRKLSAVQKVSPAKPNLVVYGGEAVSFTPGVTFDPEHSSLRFPTPPIAPEQTSPGPTFNPTDTGFEITIQPPPEAERNGARQISLHRRLQEHVQRLESALPRISNTHAMLVSEFKEYCRHLPANLADLDVTILTTRPSSRALRKAGS